MIRATHGVHNGAYYWECQIGQSVDDNAHVRIGWSTRQGELQAPVGYDRYSFAYRDISGMLNHIKTHCQLNVSTTLKSITSKKCGTSEASCSVFFILIKLKSIAQLIDTVASITHHIG